MITSRSTSPVWNSRTISIAGAITDAVVRSASRAA